MDLLEQPEIKATYDKCKYRVKLWEYNFKKRHGRLPSKLDIREAEKEVRFAYKTYFNLKSAAIERSFIDIEGFQSDEEDTNTEMQNCDNSDNNKQLDAEINESVWGMHLNNKIEQPIKENEIKSNVNASFSQKLFGGSKFSKRNPRKSLSLQNRKSKLSSSKISSQPQKEVKEDLEVDLVSSQDYLDAFMLLNSNNVKIVPAKADIELQSLDLIQTVLNNDYKLKGSLNSGWIDRIIKNTGAVHCTENNIVDFSVSQACMNENDINKPVTYDYDSDDDIIDNSEDESVGKPVLHISKKMKTTISNSSMIDLPANNLNDKKINQILTENKNENSNQNSVECSINLSVNNGNMKTNGLVVHEIMKNDTQTIIEPTKNNIEKTRVRKNVSQRKTVKTTKVAINKDRPPRRTSTRSKKATNLKEHSDADEEFDDSDKDPNYLSDKNAENQDTDEEITKKISKKRNSRKSKDSGANMSPEEHSYELEYSVKPRITSVPRLTKIPKKTKTKISTPIDEENIDKLIKTKTDIAREKLEKKITSGNLNENFVRINMKKKIYVRGKKTMTFSKYKKQMWKNKKKALCGPDMDMGGCDGGVLTCFNCGDIGHFARQCPKNKGDALLPLSSVNGAEECPFPTLEEAEKMAEESALAIRKSNKKTNKNDDENAGNSNEENDEDEIDSEDELLLAETIRLEEYVNKLDMKQYLDTTNFVKPYYELKEDGSVIDTPSEVYETLSKFGFGEFRQGQEEAIMRILSGKSTLLTLSTGSGKSLCYQLPAYIYAKREPCIALVISPLVSLMEDQVTGLPPFLKAACLHTNQTKTQREKIMELITSGTLSILLVSPEAVAAGEKSTGFGSLLRQLPPISFACIDEAHCVSQWSHNFRPSYLMICRILRERLGVTTILGLTATATVSTANNIAEHLQIPDGTKGIISDIPLPDNLRLSVSKDFNRDNALLGLLTSERFANCKSVIVYCTRRDECERIATFLRLSFKEDKPYGNVTNGKKRKRTSEQAEPYHAGLSASRRKAIQKSFMSGELRIVVATVAFGMGINKSDIRSVIHYNMPGSFESYVQEIGRAGRDGLPAHCHLFLDSEGNDENELRRHIHANSMDRHVIRKLLQKIFIPCSCKTQCPKHEVAFSIQDTVLTLDVPEENISTLLCYLELHDNRYVQVLSPAYVQCKIISYQGPMVIRKAAKECPPLAMALALYGDQQQEDNIFKFPVVDVASAMGWDSGICKHKLKNLEWTTVNNLPKRSSLSVEFTNLGFRLLAPGNLTDNELDQALDYLYKRVTDQEKMCLLQLRAVHETLTSVTAKTYRACLSEVPKNQTLKEKIREYFNSPNPLTVYEKVEAGKKPVNEEQIIADTRQLITMYRDNVFTGRAVARIFHGIQSPNFPAVIWGRCKFWRSHLKEDFHEICRISTKEILKMR